MTFVTGERVRHRRKWYGSVASDNGGPLVTVRFDDGTPPREVHRIDLEQGEHIDAIVLTLMGRLQHLRSDVRLTADEVATIDSSIQQLSFSLGENGLRLRVAAEIDRVAGAVFTDPFDESIAQLPRVRQWFSEGASWALQRFRDHANQLRADATKALS